MTAKTVETVLAGKGREVVTAWSWSTIAEASALLAGPPRIGALVVLDQAREVAGMLTEGDIVRGLLQHGGGLGAVTVESLMAHRVPTCAPSDELTSVMDTMTAWRFRHLPVVRAGELSGLISIGDVVRSLLADAKLEVAVLRDVVISRT
ncbi:CBS domain-containing protein [Pseudonocardia sp. KRD291]|uniref:CBS domain-containing protein n=1 Tax=Pseudonocardia sp. KRD291 TaxID=2792007 RepID=UPI001C49DE6A|nr:CBS domain-containing protein [Pseudonocardia sp. KRD291]MBW0101817.1 CBS domain-containing protein [Pseudonocardia sp. KRD291]